MHTIFTHRTMAARRPTQLDNHIAQVLERIGEVARAGRWKRAGGSDPSPLQARVLGHLHTHAGERMGVARLAQDLQVSRPTISDCVKALVDRGLLRRSADPLDARSHSLSLSGKGRRVLLANTASAGLDHSIATMGEADKEALLQGLMTVLQQLFVDGSVAAQRMCWTCAHYQGDRRNVNRCALLEIMLATKDLRTDCSEHVLAVAR